MDSFGKIFLKVHLTNPEISATEKLTKTRIIETADEQFKVFGVSPDLSVEKLNKALSNYTVSFDARVVQENEAITHLLNKRNAHLGIETETAVIEPRESISVKPCATPPVNPVEAARKVAMLMRQ